MSYNANNFYRCRLPFLRQLLLFVGSSVVVLFIQLIFFSVSFPRVQKLFIGGSGGINMY